MRIRGSSLCGADPSVIRRELALTIIVMNLIVMNRQLLPNIRKITLAH
jgi:hypothetical protein